MAIHGPATAPGPRAPSPGGHVFGEQIVVLVATALADDRVCDLEVIAAVACEPLVGPEHILEVSARDQSTVVITLACSGRHPDPVGDAALAAALEADLSAALRAAGHAGASVAVVSAGPPLAWPQRMASLWESRVSELQQEAVRQAEDASFRREIARILERDGLRTVFQPIVSATDGRTIGYEGLTRGPAGHRWESPERLLDAASRAGLSALVEWEMVRLIRRRAGERLADRDRLLFINAPDTRYWPYSPFPADGEPGVPWSWSAVVCEVSERTPITNLPAVWAARDRGRERGIRFALDDVGSGYAGLAALALLAPDYVKVDMAIVRDCHRDSAKQAVISALVRYAQRSGAAVIAEGVETPEEHETVRGLGVDLIQGFLIAPPSEHPVI